MISWDPRGGKRSPILAARSFLFSSRRRHTRCGRDWSSDVCSSDLPRVEIWGPLVVSETGLLDGWNVLAKATLGVVASILLAATTEQRDLLAGLERLRLPGPLVQIAGFMVRYLELILDQMRRMRTAQLSRGLPGGFRSWPATARAAGALFIRT